MWTNTEAAAGIKMKQHDDQDAEQDKQGKEEAGDSEKTCVQGTGETGDQSITES